MSKICDCCEKREGDESGPFFPIIVSLRLPTGEEHDRNISVDLCHQCACESKIRLSDGVGKFAGKIREMLESEVPELGEFKTVSMREWTHLLNSNKQLRAIQRGLNSEKRKYGATLRQYLDRNYRLEQLVANSVFSRTTLRSVEFFETLSELLSNASILVDDLSYQLWLKENTVPDYEFQGHEIEAVIRPSDSDRGEAIRLVALSLVRLAEANAVPCTALREMLKK